MNRSRKREAPPSAWRDIGGIVLAAFLLLVPGAALVDLFNPDEPREAEIAREMAVSRDVIVPHFNGCPFLEKPPLFYWCVLTAGKIPGLSMEMAARTPSILAALGLLIVTYGFGRELFDRRTGRAAALLLLTTFQFWWLGKRALLDMTLAFFIGAALWFFLMAERRPLLRGRFLVVAGLAASGAALTKGLIGLLIPGLAIVAYYAWDGRFRAIVSPRLLASGLIPLGAIGVWVAMLWARPEGVCFVREFLVENHLKRFMGEGYGGHQQPPWYYLTSLASDYLPWSLFVPGAAIVLWPTRRSGRRSDPFLHAWIIPALVVLSISSAKRSIYLLPIAAPIALMVAAWWRRRVVRSEGPRRLDLLLPGLVLAVLALVLSAGLPILVSGLLADHPPETARAAIAQFARTPWTASWGILFLAWIVWIVRLARRRLRKAGPAVLKLAGVVLFVGGGLILPLVGPMVSARPIGRILEHLRESGTRLGASDISEGSLGQFLFYSGGTMDWIRPRARKPESECADCRLLTSPEIWLAGPGPRACLMTSRDDASLVPGGDRPPRVVFESTIGGAHYVLVKGSDH